MTDVPLDPIEAGQRLNCSPKTVIRLLKQGRLKGFRFGTRKGYRVYQSSIEAFQAPSILEPEPAAPLPEPFKPPPRQKKKGRQSKRLEEVVAVPLDW